jgi:hypothetical protein
VYFYWNTSFYQTDFGTAQRPGNPINCDPSKAFPHWSQQLAQHSVNKSAMCYPVALNVKLEPIVPAFLLFLVDPLRVPMWFISSNAARAGELSCPCAEPAIFLSCAAIDPPLMSEAKA